MLVRSALLPHRALRAQIEDLATRLDHPDLAVQARDYENIKLNKQLRAAVCIWLSVTACPHISLFRPLGGHNPEDICG